VCQNCSTNLFPARRLVKFTKTQTQIIPRALKHGLVDPEHQGKGAVLTPQQEAEILNGIEEKSARNEHLSRTDILHCVCGKYNPALTKGWVNYFFLRHRDALCRITSRPQELPCLQVPRVFLERTIDNIKQYMHGQVFELVFNLDEIGYSDWEDHCKKCVIVLMVFKGPLIHHKLTGSTRHVTTLVSVTAAGDLLPPYLVIAQKLNQEFHSSGLVLGKYAVIVENRSPYANQQLFADYVNRVFLPFPRKVRTNRLLSSRLAELLMANCQCHMGDEVQKVLPIIA
jgi:hypothetical protein